MAKLSVIIIAICLCTSTGHSGRKLDRSTWPPKPEAKYYSSDSSYWAEVEQGVDWATPVKECQIKLYSVTFLGRKKFWECATPHSRTPYKVLVSNDGTFVVSLGDCCYRDSSCAAPIIVYNRQRDSILELHESEVGSLGRFTAQGGREIPGLLPPDYKRWWDSVTILNERLIIGDFTKPEYAEWRVPNERLEIDLQTGMVIYDSRAAGDTEEKK